MPELRVEVDDEVLERLDWLADQDGFDGKSSRKYKLVSMIAVEYRQRRVSLRWDDRADWAARVLGKLRNWLSDYPPSRIIGIDERVGGVVIRTRDSDEFRISREDWENGR